MIELEQLTMANMLFIIPCAKGSDPYLFSYCLALLDFPESLHPK
jgi:hypothetical protein